ncbi:hypothetical protein PRIC1_014288 [Phytophthora ramorum]
MWSQSAKVLVCTLTAGHRTSPLYPMLWLALKLLICSCRTLRTCPLWHQQSVKFRAMHFVDMLTCQVHRFVGCSAEERGQNLEFWLCGRCLNRDLCARYADEHTIPQRQTGFGRNRLDESSACQLYCWSTWWKTAAACRH